MMEKRGDKEIKAKIEELDKIKDSGKMGADRAYEKISALEECLELDEEEISAKGDDLADSDYALYIVYDWAISGRDYC